MKKTATTSLPLFLGVLCAVFFMVPFESRASTLYSQLLNDTSFSGYASGFQGLGEGLVTSTTTIANIGFQFWFNVTPNSSSAADVVFCILEYNSRSEFESNPATHPTGNSVCYHSGPGTGGRSVDGVGLISTTTSQSYTISPYKYYALELPDWSPANPILGTTNTRFNFQPLILSAGSGTTTPYGAVYFQVFSGSSPTQYFTPSPTFSGFSTSTTASTCDNSFATTTGFIDSVGSSISNGLCRAASFLFVPSQQSVNNFFTLLDNRENIIPFSYYYDFAGIIDGQTASSSVNFTPLGVNLAATGVGSTSPYGLILSAVPTTYLSTTTIMTYVSQSLYDTLFLLVRSAIWILVALHLFRRIRPGHITHA